MVKWTLLLIFWLCLQINANDIGEDNISLGIGNFPIPEFSKLFPKVSDKITNAGINEDHYYSWQIHFDLIFTYALEVKKLEILKIIDEASKLEFLTLAVSVTRTQLGSTLEFILKGVIVSQFTINTELLSMRVKIIKSKSLKVFVNNENRVENDFPDFLSEIKFIQGSTNKEMVNNVVFFNGPIDYLLDNTVELRMLPTSHIMLFKTFRILFDLKINTIDNSVNSGKIFRLKAETITLIEIRNDGDEIKYCFKLQCKAIKLEKINDWVHLIVEQWVQNDEYYLSVAENYKLDKEDLKNRIIVVNPRIQSVLLEPNQRTHVDIRNFIIFNPASNFGIVHYGGKPLYNEFWNDKSSSTVCSLLGYKNERAITIDGSILKSYNNNDYRTKTFSCEETKDSFKSCTEKASEKTVRIPVAVHCVKKEEIHIFKKTKPTRVSYAGLPLCINNINEAEHICTKLLTRDQMNKTGVYGIIFPRDLNRFNEEHFAKFSISNDDQNDCIYLNREDENCKYDIIPNCNFQHIQCATCFESSLIASLDSLLLKGSNTEVIRSLENYLKNIERDCGEWTCNSIYSDYPSYCSVYNGVSEALEELRNYEKEVSKNTVTLSEMHNFQKFLEFEFLKTNFDSLKDEIFKTKESIGRYFKSLADFDNQLANHDITYAIDMWHNSNALIKEKEIGLIESISELEYHALWGKSLELIQSFAKMAVQLAGRLNPLKLITNTDGSITDLMDTGTDITNQIADIVIIKNTYDELIENLSPILKRIEDKIKDNIISFKKISKILSDAVGSNKLTLEQSRDFLDLYGRYTPAIEKIDIDQYSGFLEPAVNKLIENIYSARSYYGAILRPFSENAVNNVNMALKLLFGQYEVVREKQFEIMEAFARSARSIIAKQSAEDIINDSNDKTNLEKKLLMIKAVYSTRVQKLRLYTELCNIYTYRNHGKPTDDCNMILKNPDINSFRLLSYVSMPDMCANSEIEKKFALIPLSLKGDLDRGVLSSNQLFNYRQISSSNSVDTNIGSNSGDSGSGDSDGDNLITDGTTYFKIPDKQWLVDHGWVSNEKSGPFFLKKLNIYLPPEANNVFYTYQLSMQLNAVSLYKTKYSFESKISNQISYGRQCENPINNPYMEKCRKSLKKVCVITDGQVNSGFLPVLENSKFQVRLQSSTKMTKLYPKEKMYLKAYVEVCSKETLTKKSQVATNKSFKAQRDIKKEEKVEDLKCCRNHNEYYDILKEISYKKRRMERQRLCLPCPSGSNAAFFGYFCQECPPNFNAATDEWFGCIKNEESTNQITAKEI
ncbi:uncharacterized protein LOC136082285 [Hydra vulgaris]|uniref:Uncharacterized protein LOC136082285 n=1 Tax=Hydra vulgaris TaxID=6087 RepID=A0ABM4C653_HYDVU